MIGSQFRGRNIHCVFCPRVPSWATQSHHNKVVAWGSGSQTKIFMCSCKKGLLQCHLTLFFPPQKLKEMLQHKSLLSELERQNKALHVILCIYIVKYAMFLHLHWCIKLILGARSSTETETTTSCQSGSGSFMKWDQINATDSSFSQAVFFSFLSWY